MAELTIEGLAADLRVQAKETVLADAREAFLALERYLIQHRICDRARLPLHQQLVLTLLNVRVRLALGIHGPMRAAAGTLPPKSKKEG